MKSSSQTLIKELEIICPQNVALNVSMADISNWRVGGRAAVLVTPSSLQQLIELKITLTSQKIPYLVIGNTTNLLFTDEDIDAVLIRVGSLFSDTRIEDEIIIAQAGLWVPKLARKALQAGLTGVEHICGIPGTLGGLVAMNGGSERKSIGSVVSSVITVDEYGALINYTNTDCNFSYRGSIFQKKNEIIAQVEIKLRKADDKRRVHDEMRKILTSRNNKFPRKQPSCGSVFVSNPNMYSAYGPPGRVIEEHGLKGLRKGEAQVSTTHANFIVNNGGATAKDILYLINVIREKIYNKTGYLMDVEAKYVDARGEVSCI